MSHETLSWLVPAHAVLAWLGTAVLVAFAGMLVAQMAGLLASQRLLTTTLATWSASAATFLVTLSGALGAMLHLPYRLQLRQRVFLHSRELGWLFERKQHLAFGAILLAWCGLSALLAGKLAFASKDAPAQARGHELHRAAAVAYIASALFGAIASVASAIVAAREHF